VINALILRPKPMSRPTTPVTRKGKIARLPYQIRIEVNRRLLDGETADGIVAWLNAQAAVADRMHLYFGGAPITSQNLSQWRLGGFRDWLKIRQQAPDANG